MRVLHVIPAVAPRYGGPSRVMVEMGRALLAAGVELLVATTDADGQGHLAVAEGQTTCYQGVPMRFFRRQWAEAFKVSRPLAQWLTKHVARFDVVHIHAIFNHSSLAAARFCQQQDVPYIVRPLGSLASWSMSQKQWKKFVVWHLGAKQMLAHAKVIHYTTSGEQKEAERKFGLKRGIVIPHGIDELAVDNHSNEPAHLSCLRNTPYVLILSRLHPVKNIEFFLQAFINVTKLSDFSTWHLVIAGDGDPDYVAGLQRLVRNMDGEERVVFAGWVDGRSKATLVQKAALLALPSFHENFGLSAVEAMACGVPVLVSDRVNLAAEIAAAGAGWVVPLDQGALGQGLRAALLDKEERAARGAAGKALVEERFTWPAVARELVRLYQRIVAS